MKLTGEEFKAKMKAAKAAKAAKKIAPETAIRSPTTETKAAKEEPARAPNIFTGDIFKDLFS